MHSVDIDLSDENGNVKNLRDTPFKYANEVLCERERLVLLRVDSEYISGLFQQILVHDVLYVG